MGHCATSYSTSYSTSADRIAAATSCIRAKWSCDAKSAIILGTGLGELAENLAGATTLEYRDIPGFPCSTALAHKGRLVCGELSGAPVIMMQGRCHLYEGYSFDELTLPVRVLAALGIRSFIITNAAGGLNPRFCTGDVMLIEDHINLMNCFCPAAGPSRAPLYDVELGAVASAAARKCDFVLHRGVYVGVSGPSYETRAEYRAFRRIGGDCVGMSTVPEVLAAAVCGLRVLGLSTVTNVACPDAPKTVTAEEVVEIASIARPRVQEIVAAVVAKAS
jgi:purine-nucleoside phosphorylase